MISDFFIVSFAFIGALLAGISLIVALGDWIEKFGDWAGDRIQDYEQRLLRK